MTGKYIKESGIYAVFDIDNNGEYFYQTRRSIMGLSGEKKDDIQCVVCGISNKKRLKLYKRKKKHPKINLVNIGGIVVGSGSGNSGMCQCPECHAYFCSCCVGEGTEPSPTDSDFERMFIFCPSCKVRYDYPLWRNALEEYRDE